MKYLKKYIFCFVNGGRWQADYAENGKRFALHRACTKTKAEAYKIASEQIDYMNRKEKNYAI